MLVPLSEPDGRPAWTVEAGDGRVFAVFHVDGRYHVTDARCPHNDGPLAQGWIRDGTTLVCPWHWYRFDLRTGACATAARYELRVYPVVQRDDGWAADVGDAPPVVGLAERLRAHARGEA